MRRGQEGRRETSSRCSATLTALRRFAAIRLVVLPASCPPPCPARHGMVLHIHIEPGSPQHFNSPARSWPGKRIARTRSAIWSIARQVLILAHFGQLVEIPLDWGPATIPVECMGSWRRAHRCRRQASVQHTAQTAAIRLFFTPVINRKFLGDNIQWYFFTHENLSMGVWAFARHTRPSGCSTNKVRRRVPMGFAMTASESAAVENKPRGPPVTSTTAFSDIFRPYFRRYSCRPDRKARKLVRPARALAVPYISGRILCAGGSPFDPAHAFWM